MKFVFFFLVIFIFTLGIKAQEKPDKLKPKLFEKNNPGNKDNPFDSSPQFKLPGPEEPLFTDSIFKKRRNITGGVIYDKDMPDNSNMPVWKPGPEFSSNMPVMVPDTSVHYFILNKKIEMKSFKPESKK
jgi:hypothetical protein